MKKALSLILTIILVLSLCACGGSGNNEEKKPEGLQVGFGKVDITPTASLGALGLGGYGDNDSRLYEGIFSKVYITCVAMSENGNTVLLYTMDSQCCSEGMTNQLRAKVSPETGVAKENIFCGATHTHSAPAPAQYAQYYEYWLKAGVQAAKDALADLASATILSAEPEIEGMNFVRHYIMSDGSYAGSNFGSFKKTPFQGHAAEGDHRMTLVKFDRPEGKEDVLLVNWSAHADHGNKIGRYNLSADYPGFLRDKIEADTGMKVAYFTGASGNMNPDSKIPEETHNLDVKAYGEKLADLAIAALPTLKPVEGSGIKVNTGTVKVNINHDWDDKLKEAEEINSTKNAEYARLLCEKYGFSSDLHAYAVIRRSKLAAAHDQSVHAFSVGGIGFINCDYEMFSKNGMYVKENSPFATTFIVTGNNSYIASEDAYEYGSYEAHIGNFEKGTAEKLAEKFVELLRALS